MVVATVQIGGSRVGDELPPEGQVEIPASCGPRLDPHVVMQFDVVPVGALFVVAVACTEVEMHLLVVNIDVFNMRTAFDAIGQFAAELVSQGLEAIVRRTTAAVVMPHIANGCILSKGLTPIAVNPFEWMALGVGVSAAVPITICAARSKFSVGIEERMCGARRDRRLFDKHEPISRHQLVREREVGPGTNTKGINGSRTGLTVSTGYIAEPLATQIRNEQELLPRVGRALVVLLQLHLVGRVALPAKIRGGDN